MVTEFLPTDLRVKNFRLWVPNRSNGGYRQRKLEFDLQNGAREE